MALKSLRALATAIADVQKEAGDSAEYKTLLSSLETVSKELGDGVETEPKRDSENDEYSFAAAERRHVARNAEVATDGGAAGGESK